MPYDLYPAVDETYNFPPEVRVALSNSLELRNDAEPMTTVVRNNLTATEKWDGRLIVNTDTDHIERWDAGTSQWAVVANATDVSKVTSVPTGFRNVIRNGDMSIAQRGEGPFTTPGYTLDGVYARAFGPSSFSASRGRFTLNDSINTDGSHYYYNFQTLNQSTADSAATIQFLIEDVRSLAGKTVTLSFWGIAGSGTYKVAVQTYQFFGTGGSPSAEVYTNQGILTVDSNQMRKYSLTFTVPSIAGKTVGSNGNDLLDIMIWTSSGSSYPGGQGIGLQNWTFAFSDIQLEEGSYATPFERIPVQQQLAWCQRYFCRLGANNSNMKASAQGWYGTGVIVSATVAIVPSLWPVPMRVAPTITFSAASTFILQTGGNAVAPIGIDLYTWDCRSAEHWITSSGLVAGQACALTHTASVPTDHIDASAEL